MNIYQKKVVKEKEYIFNEDCVQTKSTNPNSKIDNELEINSNIRKFYGIHSKQVKKIEKGEKTNRHYRSKSQIMDNKEIKKQFIPKGIKTVLIKLKSPLEQKYINNLNYKTYYSNNFYRPKVLNINNINNIRNEFQSLEFEQPLNNRQGLINNYNINLLSLFNQYNKHKRSKLTRNKSVMLNNNYIIVDKENKFMDASFNTIYKKNYCLDKHKNFGGNFKNKKRSNTNYKIHINKSNSIIKYNSNIMLNNISSLDIKNSFVSNYHKKNKNNIYENSNPNIFQIINKNKINKNPNNNLEYNLSVIKDKNNNIGMNDNIYKNENKNDKIYHFDVQHCKKEEELLKKNKLKKYIPPLNFKNNTQNISNIIDFDVKEISSHKNNALNHKILNKYNNTSQINLNKYKNNHNIITFEEPITDKNSMKKNKINLVNIINISEQGTKRGDSTHRRNSEKNKINTCSNKKEDNNNSNNSNIKYKKNSSKKINAQKGKYKSKGKMLRANSTKKIEIENISHNIKNIYKIKSIPLKLNNINNIYTNKNKNYNKFINIPSKSNNNAINKKGTNENVIIISKNDFRLWNDLTRIYDNIGKYQNK